jgi:iron complex transport system substrate-binding protein
MLKKGHMRIAVAAVLALALGACGSDREPAAGPTATATAAAATAGTFPATVRHKYGTTTVPRAPQRVVVVGLREQDALLALGVVPVATTEWYGEDPGALEPWAREKLGSRPLPTVLPSSDGIEIERVAAQRPDLIVGVDTAMTRKQYAQLSRLAPTVAPPAGTIDYGTTWQQQLELVGDAVGKRAQADELRAGVEAKIEATAAAHPEWKGKEAVNATITDDGFYVYGPKTANSRLLAELGFAFPAGLRDIGGADDFGGTLSRERAELLDIDLVLWDIATAADRRRITTAPVYRGLAVHTEGREVFERESSPLYDALSKTSVLSVSVALELLAPRFEAALDGDPATPAD